MYRSILICVMKDILKENHFSVEHFDETGLSEVMDLTGLEFKKLENEINLSNFFIGQNIHGQFYLFCETNEPQNEITFNAFRRLVGQAVC